MIFSSYIFRHCFQLFDICITLGFLYIQIQCQKKYDEAFLHITTHFNFIVIQIPTVGTLRGNFQKRARSLKRFSGFADNVIFWVSQIPGKLRGPLSCRQGNSSQLPKSFHSITELSLSVFEIYQMFTL